ncbi:MAG TPA: diguanylate cyclase [Acidimicrobiales bacterium]|nr:diguanylate cyclase [Acidimicrobiales bacterium]
MVEGESTAAVTVGSAASHSARRQAGLARWEELCHHLDGADLPWPPAQSAALIDSVLCCFFDDDDTDLETSARAWAQSTGTMAVLVRRLGCLRELLAEQGVVRDAAATERLQRILDRVTTSATEATVAELEDAALTDALTGVGNRRALETAGRAAVAAARRSGSPLSIVAIDLDGLKQINDTQGHGAGDKALAGMAASLRAALRDTDQVFRIGGDEFVALLPVAPPDTVFELMRRAERFNAPRFSWGVACAPDDGADVIELLQVADNRLYASRQDAGYYEEARRERPPALSVVAREGKPVRRHVALAVTLAVALCAVVGAAVAMSGDSATPPSGGTSHAGNGTHLSPAGTGAAGGITATTSGASTRTGTATASPGQGGANASGKAGAGSTSGTGAPGSTGSGTTPASGGSTSGTSATTGTSGTTSTTTGSSSPVGATPNVPSTPPVTLPAAPGSPTGASTTPGTLG